MKTIDSLHTADQVKVTVQSPEGKEIYQSTQTGYHNIEAAVEQAAANIGANPEDCVFEVANLTTGTTHRYRINAHGHLKLIV